MSLTSQRSVVSFKYQFCDLSVSGGMLDIKLRSARSNAVFSESILVVHVQISSKAKLNMTIASNFFCRSIANATARLVDVVDENAG